jgi:hypothetical protein
MNPDLEVIINAFAAHLENPKDKCLFEIYRSRIDDACEKSGVDRITLESAIKIKYRKMNQVRDKKTSALPPKA